MRCEKRRTRNYQNLFAAEWHSHSRKVSNWAMRHDGQRGVSMRRLYRSQQAPAYENQRNWLAAAFAHEVWSAAGWRFQLFTWIFVCPRATPPLVAGAGVAVRAVVEFGEATELGAAARGGEGRGGAGLPGARHDSAACWSA